MSHRELIEQLFSTMSCVNRMIAHQAHESYEERTSTMLQYIALKTIKHTNACTVTGLADSLNISKSSATQLIERLVKLGHIDRVHDQNDRRVIHLTITPGGIHELSTIKKRYVQRFDTIFSNLPEHDLQELVRIHTSLIESLKIRHTT